MMMKAKYGPGGEFDSDWFASVFVVLSITFLQLCGRRPPMPMPPADPPPPPEVPPPEEMPPSRPGWRPVQRGGRRIRKSRQEVTQVPVQIPETRTMHSWATWQREFTRPRFEVSVLMPCTADPTLAPTPPSVEPTLVVPDRQSPGLFGPRSPRGSFR